MFLISWHEPDIRTAGADPLRLCVTEGLLKLLIIAPLTRAFGRAGRALPPACCSAPAASSPRHVSVRSASTCWRDTASVVLFVTALTMATIPLLSRWAIGSRGLTPKTPIDRDLMPKFPTHPRW